MALPLCRDCTVKYFNNANDIKFSVNIVKFTPVLSYDSEIFKPCVPLYGVKLTAGFYEPLTVVSNRNNRASFQSLATGVLKASNNYVKHIDNGLNQYTDGNFGAYLNSQTGNDQPSIDRYNFIYSMIVNFWNNIDPAIPTMVYEQKLQELINLVKSHADYRQFLAPGKYRFLDTSEVQVSIAAWEAADVNFAGMAVLEIDSLG